MGACTVETSMEVSLNMKNRTVTGPGDSTSRCVYIYLKKTNSTNGKRHTQLSVLSSVIHSCQIEKQSVHQQMKGWRRYGGHARVHTHTHVHTHARAHTHTHAHTNVHTCVCPHGRALYWGKEPAKKTGDGVRETQGQQRRGPGRRGDQIRVGGKGPRAPTDFSLGNGGAGEGGFSARCAGSWGSLVSLGNL